MSYRVPSAAGDVVVVVDARVSMDPLLRQRLNSIRKSFLKKKRRKKKRRFLCFKLKIAACRERRWRWAMTRRFDAKKSRFFLVDCNQSAPLSSLLLRHHRHAHDDRPADDDDDGSYYCLLFCTFYSIKKGNNKTFFFFFFSFRTCFLFRFKQKMRRPSSFLPSSSSVLREREKKSGEL